MAKVKTMVAHLFSLSFPLASFRDDIIRAIKTLKPLNGGFEVIVLGEKKMVRSVPSELDKDQGGLLLLAQVSPNASH